MKRIFCAIWMLVITAAPALATKPCNRMSEFTFREKVFEPSNLVVFARVHDYSYEHMKDKWTDIEVLSVLNAKDKDRAPKQGDLLTVRQWQSQDYPLFTFGRGDTVVLFLMQDGNEALLTNGNWNLCTPSIWAATGEGATVPDFFWNAPDSRQWISLSELRDIIELWEKDEFAPEAMYDPIYRYPELIPASGKEEISGS